MGWLVNGLPHDCRWRQRRQPGRDPTTERFEFLPCAGKPVLGAPQRQSIHRKPVSRCSIPSARRLPPWRTDARIVTAIKSDVMRAFFGRYRSYCQAKTTRQAPPIVNPSTTSGTLWAPSSKRDKAIPKMRPALNVIATCAGPRRPSTATISPVAPYTRVLKLACPLGLCRSGTGGQPQKTIFNAAVAPTQRITATAHHAAGREAPLRYSQTNIVAASGSSVARLPKPVNATSKASP